METFYLIVLAIATIVFILVLLFFGLMMQKGNVNQVYPPVANTCPDMWPIVDGSNCRIPWDSGVDEPDINKGGKEWDEVAKSLTDANINVFKASTTTGNSKTAFSPADPKWSAGGLTPVCEQKKWANKNNILWDGISNFNGC